MIRPKDVVRHIRMSDKHVVDTFNCDLRTRVCAFISGYPYVKWMLIVSPPLNGIDTLQEFL